VTNPNVEFILDTLATVVDMQPPDHPLRRVNRDTSLVYEGDATVDMTQPISKRKEELKSANFVGVRSADRDAEPQGQNYNLETDAVLSVRVEALTRRNGEYGHVDPLGTRAPTFDSLCETIRAALYDERTYPDHPDFRDSKLDLRITNEDYQSAAWADFYRREYDVVLRAKEVLP